MNAIEPGSRDLQPIVRIKSKRAARIALIVIVSLAACLSFFGMILWSRIETVSSTERVGPEFYSVKYYNDYKLDNILATGAANDQELINYVSKTLYFGYPISIAAPDVACSAFGADTPSGDQIMGRNYDLHPTPVVLIKTAPQNGYKSISITSLSNLGVTEKNPPTSDLISKLTMLALPYCPFDGVNEKGLAIGVLYVPGPPAYQDTGKKPITTSLAIRMVLDKCETVQDAVAMLQKYDMHSSAGVNYHFFIMDKTGYSVIAEYIDNQFSVTEGDYVTNFQMKLGRETGNVSARHRYETLEANFQNTKGIMNENQAMALLADVSQSTSYPTQWSVVYNLDALTARVVIHREYGRVHDFSLGLKK